MSIARAIEQKTSLIFIGTPCTNSRVQRRSTYSTKEVLTKLHIDGYKIELPDTWDDFGQARILVYVRNDVNYKRQRMLQNTDLPNITLEIGLGRETKTTVNYFYLEWTSGVSGEDSQASQIQRLTRQRDYYGDLSMPRTGM